MRRHWVRPSRMPPHDRGMLVIQDDDGNAGVLYRHRLTQRKNREWNRWLGVQVVPYCPGVNSARIGTTGKLMPHHLIDIERSGGEILSHGRNHVGLYPHETTGEIAPGDTRIPITDTQRVTKTGYMYVITDGEVSELFTVAGVDSSAVYSETPLQNGYAIGSQVRASDAAIEAELKGCIDDLAALGVTCSNHIWPWNQSDAKLRSAAAQYFESARAAAPTTTTVNVAGEVDMYALYSTNMQGLNTDWADAFIDEIIAQDGVGIIYAHGESDQRSLDLLEYIIDKAISRGVRIVTQRVAVEHLRRGQTTH